MKLLVIIYFLRDKNDMLIIWLLRVVFPSYKLPITYEAKPQLLPCTAV